MKIALLFWFYKDAEVCRNRLKMLRRFNPGVPIYGLYGGNPEETDRYEAELGPWLDDFKACCTEKDPRWKWLNGDAMIAEWFRQGGAALDWDSVVVVQWDMVVLASWRELLGELKEGELLLSGLRPIEEVIDWWQWVTRDRADYLAFREDLARRFGPEAPVFCCQFIVVALPRLFLEKYSRLELDFGFIEYRLPTYAHALGIPFGTSSKIRCHWPGDPATADLPPERRTLTAQKIPIDLVTIFRNLLDRKGDRVFHPYNRLFPVDMSSSRQLLGEILQGRSAKLFKKTSPSR